MKNTPEIDYLIVANGPFLPRDILVEAALNRKIVALDGASLHLAKLGLKPDIILGDFDSVDEETQKIWGIKYTFREITSEAKPYPGKYGVTIVPIKDQNFTDLTKAIRYCDQHAAKSIDIICAIGADRMDHTLSNIGNLRSEHRLNRVMRLHTDAQTLTFAKHTQVTLQGDIGDYCGLIAFPNATFTSHGLEYNGVNFPLNFGFSESSCNRLKTPIAEIEVKGEALVIHPGQLKSQKIYSKKSYLEKFEIILENSKEVALCEISVGEWKKIESINRLICAEVNSLFGEPPIFPSTHYLSHSEKELQECADNNKPLLIGVSTQRYQHFIFLKNIDLDYSELTQGKIRQIAQELYPNRFLDNLGKES
jgi:thiamine pyrophosphokinase